VFRVGELIKRKNVSGVKSYCIVVDVEGEDSITIYSNSLKSVLTYPMQVLSDLYEPIDSVNKRIQEEIVYEFT